MAVREALLTLLAVEPSYGFRLHTELIARLPHRRSLNVGQSYTTLERARKAGLIESAGETDDHLPLFALTASGRDLVRNWLAGTDGAGTAADETTDRVLLAASLNGLLPPALGSISAVLDGELNRWRERAHESRDAGLPLDAAYQQLSRGQAAAIVDWLDSIRRDGGTPLAMPFATGRPRRGRPRRTPATEA